MAPRQSRVMPASEEIKQKVRQLIRVKHLMNNWESHPKGDTGASDNGGFIEGIQVAIERGWDMTEKRVANINKMYEKYIVGGETPALKQSETSGDSFHVGNIERLRSTEGWRLKINGVLIGVPTIREHAYIIAVWMDQSVGSIERFFQSETKAEPDGAAEANNAVEEL